ncbi:MAG: alpha/beta hydrolase [Bacteriovoracaceae bacterium]|nr:alpha/beta hydrolase [Bacteriovoracaceae bacterium]
MMKLIFLHGFPDNSKVWSHCIEYFKERAECLAPDIHSLDFKKQQRLLDDLCEGSQDVVLIGHDMGGPLAVEYAQQNPSKIRKVILINSMGLEMFAHRLKLLEQMLRSSYMSVFINPFVNTTTLKLIHKKILNAIYNSAKLDKDDPLRTNSSEVLDGLARYKEFAFIIPKKLFNPSEPVIVPVDVIFGEDDPFLMIPSENEMKRFFQDARLHKTIGGHWPMRTHPEELNHLIETLIFGTK